MKGFQKGITLRGRTSGSFYILGLQKNLHNFASELGFKLGVMTGFRKGITLGGRTSGSARKVCMGGVGWLVGLQSHPVSLLRLSVTFL